MSNRLLIAIAFFGWSIWSFANKLVVQRMHPSTMQITNYVIGILAVPFFIWLMRRDPTVYSQGIDWVGMTIAVIGSIFGLAAYAAFTFALRTGDVGITSVICSSYPVLVLLMSCLFLGERLTVQKIIGVAAVAVGMTVLTVSHT
jgi:drug/metabolite transporter (DMT)-like permease